MKKVLIICDLFPPAFGPRMGYLCKYLPLYGWSPTILTEAIDETTFTFLKGEHPVTRVNFYTANNKYLKRIQWGMTFLLDFFFGYKDKRMYKEARKLIEKESFDLILTSSYRIFPLPSAQKASRKYKLPLVVDLRDIFEQYTGNEFIAHQIPDWLGLDKPLVSLFKKKSINQRNRILKEADYITTISPWHVDTLKQYNANTGLIYNGFDPELFYPEKIRTPEFIITYTGRLISTAMRNPELLFDALSVMHKEGSVTPDNCRVHWYVDETSWKIIIEAANKAGVSQYMDFKGYVPALAIPNILNSSSVLLLLTNKASDTGPKGIMTTKFFESLAVEKPILCIRSDESYLARAISEANAGLAATTTDEVCDFLLYYYNEWKQKGYTTSDINHKVLNNYSRKQQAKQFADIFNFLCK